MTNDSRSASSNHEALAQELWDCLPGVFGDSSMVPVSANLIMRVRGALRSIVLSEIANHERDTNERSDDSIREAFEIWAARNNLATNRKGDGYKGPYAEWCWHAFYAASRLAEARTRSSTAQLEAANTECLKNHAADLDRLEQEIARLRSASSSGPQRDPCHKAGKLCLFYATSPWACSSGCKYDEKCQNEPDSRVQKGGA